MPPPLRAAPGIASFLDRMRSPTPRGITRTGRGFGTLIGNGWLREPPPPPARPYEVLSREPMRRSAMRKCMFMEVPEQLRAAFPVVSASALPPPPRAALPEPIIPRRHDPARDVRLMPVYQPAPRAAGPAMAPKPAAAWWEDPVALGSLLILVPPIGLAAVWSSKRYSSDARWALTVMTALTMCLVTAVAVAALVMR
ncbi:MAG: hypothetical protein JWP97_3072 [Labilithrix sp.]|nr:hypothetical protein [Labilithrix sp.]